MSAVGAALNLGPLAPVSSRAYPDGPYRSVAATGLHAIFFTENRTRCSDSKPRMGRPGQPRDLLCALTPNKGHLYFATARRVSCLGRSNRLVKSCELTIGPLFEVKAHSRSLGCAPPDFL